MSRSEEVHISLEKRTLGCDFRFRFGRAKHMQNMWITPFIGGFSSNNPNQSRSRQVFLTRLDPITLARLLAFARLHVHRTEWDVRMSQLRDGN
jgi:hypothetical protein